MTYQPYDPINSAPPAQQPGYPPQPGYPAYPSYDPSQQSGPPASPAPYYAPVSVPPPMYAQPVVVAVAGPPSSGMATASLVLGLIGILIGYCVGGLPSILAIIFGHIGLVQTKDGQRSGRGMAVAGLVLGYICVVPMIIFTIILFGLIFGGAAAGSGTSTGY